MKKILVFFISAILLVSMSLSAMAADVRPTDTVREAGKHLVIMTQKAEMFSWDGLFQAGLAYGSIADGALKLPATAEQKMISVYYDQGPVRYEGIQEAHWPAEYSIDTKAFKYFTITYKSEGAFSTRLFMTFDTFDGTDFGANGYMPTFDFPASADYTTAIVAIPADQVSATKAISFVTRWDVMSAAADVYVKEIGFFATEADAKTYYNIQDPAPEQPTDPETPAPETADFMTVALVVAASAGAVLTLSKKKR